MKTGSNHCVLWITAALCAIPAVAIAVPPTYQLRFGGQGGYELPRYQPQHPTVSPYAALAGRAGLGGASTYYTFVRPQIDQHATNAIQSNAVRQLQQSEAQLNRNANATGTRTSGPKSSFMTQDRYFNTLRTR